MTEEEWMKGDDPKPLWAWVRESGASDRKLYLFGCACCRRIWDLLNDSRSRRAIEVGEQFVDGLATAGERDIAATDSDAVTKAIESARPSPAEYKTTAWKTYNFASHASSAAHALVYRDEGDETVLEADLGDMPAVARAYADGFDPTSDRPGDDTLNLWRSHFSAERAEQSKLLRDIFGNPFRPVAFSPEWRTDTAVSLARQMYEWRDFGAMPILADALQDAGCDSEDVLSHCRGGGPHVRGCWVVDLVLGKE